jgi:hypothetical protein
MINAGFCFIFVSSLGTERLGRHRELGRERQEGVGRRQLGQGARALHQLHDQVGRAASAALSGLLQDPTIYLVK